MLRLGDLPGLYREVGREEAIAIAELGVQVYQAAQDRLMGIWAAQQSAEEGTRAEGWKAQGAAAALESLKGRLAAGDAAAARVAALQAGVDAEVDRRLADALASAHKDAELAKMKEIGALREQIASESGKGEYVKMLKEAHAVMRERIAALEAQVAAQMTAATKSSHAIGKAGEATVMELLSTVVIPALPYASVKDMTTVSHAADFHLSVMLETGTKAKLLIDSKKYKRRVNTTEIEKLYADIDADEEAHGGIMISLESHIFTMKQFQIARSPKQKPVIFISFCDINEDMRKEMILWSVRIVMDVLSQNTTDNKDAMIENLNSFLNSLDDSIVDLDGSLRSLAKTMEGLKTMRDGFIRKIVNFRAGKATETDIDTALLEGCLHVSRNGVKCGRKLIAGTTTCKAHVKKGEEE
jgi:uncharacterized protein (DUF2164 family)